MKTSAAKKWWVRGSVWTLTMIVPLACVPRDSITGPNSPEDPFAEFDKVAPESGPAIGMAPGVRFSLSPPVATKPSGRPKSTSKKIKARRGGSLFVRNGKTSARFGVPAGSIERDTKIKMTLEGSGMSTVVYFEPSGLQFDPPGILDIGTPVNDLDAEDVRGYLHSEDGTTEEVRIQVVVIGDYAFFRLWIAHFSSADYEDDYEDDETDDDDLDMDT